MPEFLKLLPPGEALELFLSKLAEQQALPLSRADRSSRNTERIDSAEALGRITSTPVVAAFPLPSFPRSAMDGYALRAADTFGASDALPAYLRIIGEAPMGAAPGFLLSPAECALIHTGGMLPEGADAVVMVENTQVVRTQPGQPAYVEILRAVAAGENVLQMGEDVSQGQEVIAAGTRLRPAEIGGLMALGIMQVDVKLPPRVGILSSGDEVTAPGAILTPGKVYDANSFSLSALVEQVGGEAKRYGIVPDQAEALRQRAAQALAECDLVVITAGSSASERDLTAQVINELGSPGVLVHGVSIRPGKPTILAICQDKAVIGLPGNPVSALVIAWLFVAPVIEMLLGLQRHSPRPTVQARLSLNLPSQAGREDWAPVRLVPASKTSNQIPLAEPVFGKSNLIFTLARADGLVRIPTIANGLEAGEIVEVFLM